METLKKGITVSKVKGDKESIKTTSYQIAQITTRCVHHNIRIIDCIITFGGTKDILREVKKLDSKVRFDYLIVYSPAQVAQSEEEYNDFVSVMKKEFDVEVIAYRSGV